ncbi:MAG TPA: ATP synthase F0 subunit B [Pyrinomonadaceae bacterium]|nr:ATP synthase F0 subunit B [Pyrinomonadaceae bacterium]
MTVFALAGTAIQLVPDGTILIHLGLVGIMVALLNVTLLKPINRVLEERDRRTKGRLGEARDVLARVDQKVANYETRLREARTRGYQWLEQERKSASQERERKVAALAAELASWREEEKEKLKRDGELVKGALTKDAQLRAFEISNRILGRR